MSQTAAHVVHHVVLHVSLRQRLLSLPIPRRVLLAARPKLIRQALQAVNLAYSIAFGHGAVQKGELQR